MISRERALTEHTDRSLAVLLVDRHTMVREGLGHILAEEDSIAVVGSTSDGQEAILLSASLQPDVCILDPDMPEVEQIMQRIASGAPVVALLILAADEDVAQAVSLVRAGARGYLCKRTSGRDLIMAIHALGRGELVLSAHILQAAITQVAQHLPGRHSADELSHEDLSARELEVLGLLCQGYSDKAIAQTLYLSVRTINSHVSHIYARLGVGSRTEAMHVALERGLVTLTTAAPTPPHQ